MQTKKTNLQDETASTKERIVQTALALFKERGIAGVSTRDVSDACSLSRSHLYHYFADWHALRNGVFTQLAVTELDDMLQAVDTLPPIEAIALFISVLLPVDRDSSWMLWLDAWDEALRDDTFAKIYLSAMNQWEAILTGIITRGIEKHVFHSDSPNRAVKQIFAVINGYAADLLLIPSRKSQKAAVRDVTEVAALLLRAEF